jgi:hypothetical protein
MELLRCAGLIAAFVLATACSAAGFACVDASDCQDGSLSGVCEPSGYCSFGDDSCDSGQRYGAHAPSELAGMCVDPTAGSDGGSTDSATTVTTTITTTLDGGTIDDGVGESSGTRGTTTTASETSSTTSPVGTESTGNPDSATSVATTSTDSVDPTGASSSTGDPPQVPDCANMPADFCGSCLCDYCEQELSDCTQDAGCTCWLECHADGHTQDECTGICGDSMVRESLWACTSGLCGDECLLV